MALIKIGFGLALMAAGVVIALVGRRAMQSKHVPSLGQRYWVALCIASVFGANMGDFFAKDLDLGHVRGLPILAVMLAIIFIVERRDRKLHQVYYWLAIIVVRTAATNLADLAKDDMNLDWVWVLTGFTILLVIAVLFGRFLSPKSTIGMEDEGGAGLPKTDSFYWASMLVAGTLGTVLGDFTSFGSGLGLAKSSIVLSVILGGWFSISRGLLRVTPFYWTTIVLVRAAGTAVGDYLARDLGLPLSTILTGVLMVITLTLWRQQRNPQLPAG
jgi:uncharacterized membrane-anchored protein